MGSGRASERRVIGRHYLYALRRAQKRIWIANAYFIPSMREVHFLGRAVRRGVDVRILAPVKTDSPPVYYASRAAFDGLLKRGVRIWEYQERVLHSKTLVIDGVWSSVGSYNLDHLSLVNNYELTAIVLDAAFGARMEAAFEGDLANGVEVRRQVWRRRPWFQKVKEQFFYQMSSVL